MEITLEREASGRYVAYLSEPRVRIGLIHGKPGHWYAEGLDGKTITAYNTRDDAGAALINQYRLRKYGG